MDLVSIIADHYNANDTVRNEAAAKLRKQQESPSYLLDVLQICGDDSFEHMYKLQIQKTCADGFTRFVKEHWGDGKISEQVQNQVKENIVALVCSVHPSVQEGLCEGLALISEHDFPEEWPTLLDEFVARLQTTDLKIIFGLLQAMNSIFKRFRNVFDTDEVRIVLVQCLDKFQAAHLSLAQKMKEFAENPEISNNAEALTDIFSCMRLLFRIFYSLNWIELPEFYEDHISEWMTIHSHFLKADYACLHETLEDQGPLEQIRAAVLDNLTLYATKNEEEFKPYFEVFTGDVWNKLTELGTEQKYDNVMTAGLKFLSVVVSRPMNKSLFESHDTLQTIIQQIVVPNLHLRECDEEVFEDTPVEYIRRENEGNNVGTRRRAAKDLVKSLCKTFPDTSESICQTVVGSMLQEYQGNPAEKWKQKNAAIQLVTAVAIRKQTRALGVTEVSATVDILQFFQDHVVGDLQTENVNAMPVVVADCLNFITIFRTQLPKESFSVVIPLIAKFLSAESIVVHSFAALCIERLLTVRELTDHFQKRGNLRYGPVDLIPFAETLLQMLAGLITNNKENDNEYAMRCIMRIVNVIGNAVKTHKDAMLDFFNNILIRVACNSMNSRFNHYLFETLAALIRALPTEELSSAEDKVFAPFQQMLAAEQTDFFPYIFQVLAHLLEMRTDISPNFQQLFEHLLHHKLWEAKGNVPALTLLMKAYLKKGAAMIVDGNMLSPILGIYQRLIQFKLTEESGIQLIESVVSCIEPAALSDYVKPIFTTLFNRLTQKKTAKFVGLSLAFFSSFIMKRSGAAFMQVINSIQPGMFEMILTRIWLTDDLKSLKTSLRKPVLHGMYRILNELKNPEIACSLVSHMLSLLGQKMSVETIEDEETELEYSAQFSRLSFASHEAKNPYISLPDPEKPVMESIQLYCQQNGGQFLSLLQTNLVPELQERLQTLCQKHSIALV